MSGTDTVIETKKCMTCGGYMVLMNDTYYCPYCENLYTAGTLQKTVRTSVGASAAGNSKRNEQSGVNVFDENIDGVLEIYWEDGQYKYSGSGFIVNSDGYAITNTHVVTHEDGTGCSRVNVRIKGVETSADVIVLGDNKHGLGSGIDLALIRLAKVPGGAKALRFADFNMVKNGQKVYVIGNSLGYGTCITSGIVSDRLRTVDGDKLLMTDCAINGGNSGGPMFNEDGAVIGVIVSGIDGAEGMNFAIPSSDVLNFIGGKKPDIKESLKLSATKYSSSDVGRRCPSCGGTNTQYTEGRFWWCTNCDYEW